MVWQKGQSGNPTGRPKGAAGVARYIAEQTNDCRELVDRLLVLSRDEATPIRERFGATEALLSRAIGRPMQPQEINMTLDASLTIPYPPGWDALPRADRVEWLRDFRMRRLSAVRSSP